MIKTSYRGKGVLSSLTQDKAICNIHAFHKVYDKLEVFYRSYLILICLQYQWVTNKSFCFLFSFIAFLLSWKHLSEATATVHGSLAAVPPIRICRLSSEIACHQTPPRNNFVDSYLMFLTTKCMVTNASCRFCSGNKVNEQI